MSVYAVVCKNGKLHGRGSNNPMRWLCLMAKYAKEDCADLNRWEHLKCGPHRVAVLTEASE